MPNKCCVPDCTVIGGHKFPRDVFRKKQWLAAIRRKNFKPSKHTVVCKKHFTPEDFTLPKDSVFDNPTPVLKKDAVPSLFDWDDLEQNDKIDMIGETTNQNVAVRLKPVAKDDPGLKACMEAIGPAIPFRPKLVHATYNSGLKAGVASRQPLPKLRRVLNNPSLIAQLEKVRKTVSVRPNHVSAACNDLQVGSDADSQAKLLQPSFWPKKEPEVKQTQSVRPKLNLLPKVGYQMNPSPVIRACLKPCDAPVKIQEVQPEKEIDTQENDNHTYFTTNPAAEVDTTTFRDHIMSEEDIKKENTDFVTVEIGCVKVEFESKFEDKAIQCNIGDPCCSLFFNRKRPCSDPLGYSNGWCKLKKRRISV